MKITGRDYTDGDLIAPWDPARRQSPIPNGIRDDPDYDPRDDRDPPTEEAKPCQP